MKYMKNEFIIIKVSDTHTHTSVLLDTIGKILERINPQSPNIHYRKVISICVPEST